MRGSYSFNSLFSDVLLPPAPRQEGKGRSPELNEKRDELLIHRYFAYGLYGKLRYEVIMQRLGDEFFLSERRIQDIISASIELLRDLRRNPPSLADLRRRWPHLVWQF